MKYSSDNWQLLFDRNSLGISANAELRYVASNGQLVINNLPHELRAIIESELKEKGLINES